jgi:hypothetical protein
MEFVLYVLLGVLNVIRTYHVTVASVVTKLTTHQRYPLVLKSVLIPHAKAILVFVIVLPSIAIKVL